MKQAGARENAGHERADSTTRIAKRVERVTLCDANLKPDL